MKKIEWSEIARILKKRQVSSLNARCLIKNVYNTYTSTQITGYILSIVGKEVFCFCIQQECLCTRRNLAPVRSKRPLSRTSSSQCFMIPYYTILIEIQSCQQIYLITSLHSMLQRRGNWPIYDVSRRIKGCFRLARHGHYSLRAR